ncbi:MAG: deoxyribose-phosphate aldolase [Nitrospinae bacterium]|nr:deoxyribose-phosphate aldolase [Nitrospinota bacterium]
MTVYELAGYIDLSLLKPQASKNEVEALIQDAQKYPFASVCIPPCYTGLAAKMLKEYPVKVGTVVGFPLGYQTTSVKLHEAREAVETGAEEIDMVMNISGFKSGELKMVQDEILEISSAIPQIVVKVIIETCYLTDEEKATACKLVIDGGGDFVKTSTGFGHSGATADDVRLLANTAAGRIKVKASGGIKNLNNTLKMIEAGANRIGTSAGVNIITEYRRQRTEDRVKIF